MFCAFITSLNILRWLSTPFLCPFSLLPWLFLFPLSRTHSQKHMFIHRLRQRRWSAWKATHSQPSMASVILCPALSMSGKSTAATSLPCASLAQARYRYIYIYTYIYTHIYIYTVYMCVIIRICVCPSLTLIHHLLTHPHTHTPIHLSLFLSLSLSLSLSHPCTH